MSQNSGQKGQPLQTQRLAINASFGPAVGISPGKNGLPSLNPEWHYSFAMCESHTRKLPQSRGKWDKIALEEALGMSQLLVSSCQELQESHPIKDKDLDGKVIAQFLSGDLNFELELQSALSEKEERLSTLRIERHPCLNAGDAGQ